MSECHYLQYLKPSSFANGAIMARATNEVLEAMRGCDTATLRVEGCGRDEGYYLEDFDDENSPAIFVPYVWIRWTASV